MRLKALFSALAIAAVLASGAGTFHATRTSTSATHSGAATAALVTAHPQMTSDGIGWD